jgi:crotonobetainyl-CoA:carnitine CoA-transferase CaiB-like acyl-CoA transferase
MYEMLQQEQLKRTAGSQHQRLDDSPLTTPISAFQYATDGPVFDNYCARHGEDTDDILGGLGLSAQQLAVLREAGVI